MKRLLTSNDHKSSFYSLALKMWGGGGGYIGFGLSVIPSICLFVPPFVRHSFFVSAEYL